MISDDCGLLADVGDVAAVGLAGQRRATRTGQESGQSELSRRWAAGVQLPTTNPRHIKDLRDC